MTRACPSTFTQLSAGYQTDRKPSNAQTTNLEKTRPAARASLPLHIHNNLEPGTKSTPGAACTRAVERAYTLASGGLSNALSKVFDKFFAEI